MHKPTWSPETQVVIRDELAQRLPPRTPLWVTNGILSLTGLEELNQTYAELGETPTDQTNLFEEALHRLRIRLDVQAQELTQVPATGAVIVVANHPFGAVDGLALGAAMLRRRNDVLVIANTVLAHMKKLAPWFINVEVMDSRQRVACNAVQLRTALRHLVAGGLLVVFPAGVVSRFQTQLGEVTDANWNVSVGLLARRSGATVVPCYFAGSNSLLFHAAGVVHPHLGTLLLPRELLARRDTQIQLRVGHPVQPSTIKRLENDEILTTWLRLRTYDLQAEVRRPAKVRFMQPLARAVDPNIVRLELSKLPKNQCLVDQGPYRVYLASQADMPRTLQEIARLRELTFRSVGEGTGCARDLDVFDSTYRHLVLYDTEKGCVVGAYRLVLCEQAMAAQGFSGLYTNSLFRFRAPMRSELSKAIELGRSFIRPEYQRKPLTLALLWRGIGEVLRRNPQCRRLVGPVSISDQYRGTSRRLLVSFLDEVRSDVTLRKYVDPRHPLHISLSVAERRILLRRCRSVRDLSQTISEIDASGLRVPVLLEKYLELGARVLALSLDPTFGNCIDALVVVDLDRAPENILKRFMGDAGLAAYRTFPRCDGMRTMAGQPVQS